MFSAVITAEKGGICLFLQEECCFYANKSGIVQDKIRKLQEDPEKRHRKMWNSPFGTGFGGLLPYFLPLLGPLFILLLVVSFGPCLNSIYTKKDGSHSVNECSSTLPETDHP